MAVETLTLKSLETVAKRDGSGEFYKAIFAQGRKGTFFSKSLREVLDPLVGQDIGVELNPAADDRWDPSVEKVVLKGKQVWPSAAKGGGGRPLVSDQQMQLLAGGLDNIAAAIRALASSLEAKICPPTPIKANPQQHSSMDREDLLEQLSRAAHLAFGGRQKLWEAWLTPALAELGAQATEDLTLGQLQELLAGATSLADARSRLG